MNFILFVFLSIIVYFYHVLLFHLDFVIALYFILFRFKLYGAGTFFRDIRILYFLQMVYDEVVYVLASLYFFGLVVIT
jgi:hypothetical protein